MANKNTVATNERVSGLVSMKSLIVLAHNTNNTHAISEDEALEVGVTSQSFNQWKSYVEELRKVSIAYHDLSLAKDTSTTALNRAEGAVFAMWKDVLGQADVEKFSRNWFVRKSDAAWMLACVKKNVSSKKGSLQGHKSQSEFRREVERLIGCRIASNEVLSDENLELIQKYESSEKNIVRQNETLNGKKDKIGLEEQLALAEKKFDEKKALIANFTDDEETSSKLLATDILAVKAIKDQIKAAKKSLKESTDYVDSHKQAYGDLMETIAEIEA